MRNQSLSYWPTLLFPVLYPIGLGLAGILLIGAGVLGRHHARRAGEP